MFKTKEVFSPDDKGHGGSRPVLDNNSNENKDASVPRNENGKQGALEVKTKDKKNLEILLGTFVVRSLTNATELKPKNASKLQELMRANAVFLTFDLQANEVIKLSRLTQGTNNPDHLASVKDQQKLVDILVLALDDLTKNYPNTIIVNSTAESVSRRKREKRSVEDMQTHICLVRAVREFLSRNPKMEGKVILD